MIIKRLFRKYKKVSNQNYLLKIPIYLHLSKDFSFLKSTLTWELELYEIQLERNQQERWFEVDILRDLLLLLALLCLFLENVFLCSNMKRRKHVVQDRLEKNS